MPPALLALLLVAGLVALIPVWRLRVAGWRPGWLITAWLVYGIGILTAVGFPAPTRFLLPILVLAFVAPFVAGPERLARLLGPRATPRRPVVDVTPRQPPALPPPAEGDARNEDGTANENDEAGR
jgi:hypothetical protein